MQETTSKLASFISTLNLGSEEMNKDLTTYGQKRVQK
jgi:hypothetical protein